MARDDITEHLHRLQGEMTAYGVVLRALMSHTPEVRRVLQSQIEWFHSEALYSGMPEATRQSFDTQLAEMLAEPR